MIKSGKFWIPDDDTYFRNIFEDGRDGFELDHLSPAIKYCRERDKTFLAIDGGAHVGSWAMAMAKHFTQVLAVEAQIETYKCLKKNTRSFHNVTCENLAIGDDTTSIKIRNDTTRIGNTGSNYVCNVDTNKEIQYTKVRQIRIDDLYLPVIDLLKLDIEGYEYYGLSGAEESISAFRPVIIVEEKNFKNRYAKNYIDAQKLLKKWGYKLLTKTRNDAIYVRD